MRVLRSGALGGKGARAPTAPGTPDHAALASLRGLPVSAIDAAVAGGILSFGEHYKMPAWFIRDEWAGCARRLDGKPWTHRTQPAKADDVPGTSGPRVNGWPVGMLPAREYHAIIVCEGGPDALAAYAARVALRGTFGIGCLLGSLTIHESALPHFAGKRVRFIAHNDPAGIDCAERNARLLADIAEQVSIATLDGLHTVTGTPANDLCDALAFLSSCRVPDEVAELFDFARASARVRTSAVQRALFATAAPANGLVTQDDSRNTHREHKNTHIMGGEEKERVEAIHHKARELASTGRHQSYRKLFLLAQAVCGFLGHTDCKSNPLSTAIFDTWYSASRLNLDPQEGRAEYLGSFRSKFRKVRIIPGQRHALEVAEARARASTLPDIPDAADAPHGWRLLAAVCRELQRQAGGAPFFIGVRDAARIATGKSHPQTGSRILEALEDLGVIRCVKKGAPTIGGKASEFRYVLP